MAASENGGSPLIVAIDGPVGVGKSSVAREVAERLGVPFLETGAMYRALGLKVLDEGADPGDADAVGRVAEEIDLRLEPAPDGNGTIRVLLDGEPLPARVRDAEVGEATSRVAAHPGVRRRMVELQRRAGRRHGAVVEGRDIGSAVFPDTPCKFFLEASVEERVERRLRQLREQGRNADRREIEREIESRDHRDRTRADSPLVRDSSYVVVDTDELDLEGVVERIVGEVERIRGGLTQDPGTP